MKKLINTVLYMIFGIIFVAGLALLAYPTVSDWWNSLHQSRAILSYAEAVSKLSDEDYDRLYEAAESYNAEVRARSNPYDIPVEQVARYETTLNLEGNGIMGYINIPSINCNLPIYHGTEERILQIAVGHLEWTSLPVGGASSHCVLSGHRGLPSARLFTDIDKLVVGDTFLLCILDETLTYEVDQILIVLPEETAPLRIVEGKDYCTLVTCTPYGINTHRLLVRGHRISNEEIARSVRVTADGGQINDIVVAPFVAVPLLIALTTWMVFDDKRTRDEDMDIYLDELEELEELESF